MNRLSPADCFDSLTNDNSDILVFIGQGYHHRVHRTETHLVLVSYDDDTRQTKELRRKPIADTVFEMFMDLGCLADY